jgi:CheY-like chemotaxis protein
MLNTKRKILVADDDPAILEVITLILEDEGYTVKTTSGGNTERSIQEYLPDLVLLDIWMSGMDGRNICKNLKSQKLTRHIPIIMISANKDTESIAKKAGADGFITKPFEMNDLLSTVSKYTSSKIYGQYSKATA